MTRTPRPPATPITWPFTACPDCHNRDFIAEDGDGTVIFTCLGCAASWRYSLGYLVPVVTNATPSR